MFVAELTPIETFKLGFLETQFVHCLLRPVADVHTFQTFCLEHNFYFVQLLQIMFIGYIVEIVNCGHFG